jgi:hypothetical protein
MRYTPPFYAGGPLVFAAAQGIEFLDLVRREGLEAAIKQESIAVAADFVGPSVSFGLWKTVLSRMPADLAGTPYAQLAEKAFKKTISSTIRTERPSTQTRELSDKYSAEGFLQSFMANYLFEISQFVLHSQFSEKSTMEYYTDFQGRLVDSEGLDRFEMGLRAECENKARTLIGQLRETGLVDQLTRAELSNPQVAQQLVKRMEGILGRILSEK